MMDMPPAIQAIIFFTVVAVIALLTMPLWLKDRPAAVLRAERPSPRVAPRPPDPELARARRKILMANVAIGARAGTDHIEAQYPGAQRLRPPPGSEASTTERAWGQLWVLNDGPQPRYVVVDQASGDAAIGRVYSDDMALEQGTAPYLRAMADRDDLSDTERARFLDALEAGRVVYLWVVVRIGLTDEGSSRIDLAEVSEFRLGEVS